MLDNPIKREVVKTTGAMVAVVSGDPLAAVLATSLALPVETLGYLGQKRTKELFVTQEFVDKVIAEVRASDDFASFVYDVWMKHNFESSEIRRKRLQSILTHATLSQSRDFENFTRVIMAAQQIDELQLKVLDSFYKTVMSADQSSPIQLRGTQGLDGRTFSGFKINAIQFAEIVERECIDFKLEGSEDFTSELNQICYLGLLSSYVAMDGEYYLPTRLGIIFLEYIKRD